MYSTATGNILLDIIGPLIGIFFWIFIVWFFLKLVFGNSNTKSTPSTQNPPIATSKDILSVLENAKAKGQTIDQLISEYKQTTVIQPNSVQTAPMGIAGKTENKIQSGWNHENNILFLLYLGALLILVSAVTFVAFNWVSISGITKVLGLVAVTLAFYIGGLILYKNSEKLKPAGVTFATIGALLVPFCGIAFYNFIVKVNIDAYPLGFASTWMITSWISLVCYFILAKLLKKKFFGYISALTTLSFLASFINVAKLQPEFYIFSCVFTSYILWIFARFSNQEQEKYLGEPFRLSAQIILPISLVWGVILAIGNGTIQTHTTALGIMLGALFYILAYTTHKQLEYIYAFIYLVIFGVYIESMAANQSVSLAIYAIFIVILVLMAVSQLLESTNKSNEAKHVRIASTIAMIITLIVAQLFYASRNALVGSYVTFFDIIAYSTVFTLVNLYTYVCTKSSKAYLLLNLGVVIFFLNIFNHQNFSNYLYLKEALMYVSLAMVNLLMYKRKIIGGFGDKYFYVFSLLALISASRAEQMLGEIAFVLAIITLYRAIIEQKIEQLILGPIFLWIFLGKVINNSFAYDISGTVFTVTVLATIIQTLYIMDTTHRLSKFLFWISLIVEIQTLFGYRGGHIDSTAIICLGLLTIILALKAYMVEKRGWAYFAGLSALITYFWILDWFKLTYTLPYTIPFGLYLLVIAEIEHRRQNSAEIIVQLLGFGVLLLPTLSLATTETNGIFYAIFMAGLGTVMAVLGAWKGLVRYKPVGIIFIIVATFTQVIFYMDQIPGWLITSVIGVAILATAVYLLKAKK